MTNFQAIIFDMDGLLVNSEVTWLEAETQLIEARGHAYTEDVRAQIIGLRIDEFMHKLHAIYQFQEPVADLIVEVNTRMLELIPVKVQPQPGAHELIQYVKENGIPCAIASSSPKSIIDATIESQGWEDVFKYRFSAEDDERGKPAPDVYLRTVKSLGFTPADCLALEDSPNGARAAVAAGLVTYAVPDKSHTKPAAFSDITPHVFDSLHDVLSALKKA